MIDKVVADIPSADKVLRQLLVQRNFSRADFKLKWRRAESGGNWHYSDQFKMEGGFVGHWSNRKADRVSVPSVIQLNLGRRRIFLNLYVGSVKQVFAPVDFEIIIIVAMRNARERIVAR
jgi:hypothetical protein